MESFCLPYSLYRTRIFRLWTVKFVIVFVQRVIDICLLTTSLYNGQVSSPITLSLNLLFCKPMGSWTPTPLLFDGPPFPYPDVPISTVSNTEAFNTGIDTRDGRACIVCGRAISLEYCHIVPKVEDDRVRSCVYSIYLTTLTQLHSVGLPEIQGPYPFGIQDRCPRT